MKHKRLITSALLSMVLAVVLMVAMFPLSAFAQYTYEYCSANGTNYIYQTCLYFSSDSNSKATEWLSNNGWTPVGGNFNAGDGNDSKYIHLGVKYTTDPKLAVRGFQVRDSSDRPNSYTAAGTATGATVTWYKVGSGAITQTPAEGDGVVDLNKGGGGNDLTLYITIDPKAGPPVTAYTQAQNGDAGTAQSALTNNGWSVAWDQNGNWQDCNEGSGGDYLYEGYKSSASAVSTNSLRNTYNQIKKDYIDSWKYLASTKSKIQKTLDAAKAIMDAFDNNAGVAAYTQEQINAAQTAMTKSTEGINMANLDLNGFLDGSTAGDISDFGTADVTVNGTKVLSNCTDFWKQAEVGSSYSISNIKTSSGKKYLGIYSGELSGTIASGGTAVSLSYASYRTVTLNGQSATTAGSTSQTVVYTQAYSGITCPTRTGYTFRGYYTEANGKGTQYFKANGNPSRGTWNINKDTTLYAYWTANTYTVNYNGNVTDGSLGGSTGSSSHTYDTAKAVTANGFTRKYTVSCNFNGGLQSNVQLIANAAFAGWYREAALTNKVCDNGGSVKNLTASANGSVTLYAKWTLGKINLPAAERTGYIFDGWYENAECTGTSVGNAGSEYTPTKNITLYAKWTPVTYSVVFNGNGANGGAMNQTLNLTYDKGEILPVNEYTRSHTVTFNYNNGQTQTSQTLVAQFLGWSTNASDTDAMYIDGGLADNMASTQGAIGTLYAIWDCGEVILPTPNDKKDCDFEAWYSDEGCTQFAGYAGDSFTVSKATSLYAKWVVKKFNVTFQTEDGIIATVKCELNNTPVCSVVPTKAFTSMGHYVFDGWSPAIQPATADITYTAQFKLEGHTGGSTTVIEDSTCVSFGTSQHKCGICDFTWEIQDIPQKQHNFNKEIQAEKYFKSAATCTTPLTYYYCCSECGQTGTTTFTVGDVLPHTVVIDAEVPATCQATGLTQGKHCSVCNLVIEKQEVTDKTDHKMVVLTESSATCLEGGKKTSICSVCGFIKEEDIQLGEHEYKSVYTVDIQATCTTEGSESIHCRICDAKKPDSARNIEPKGHNEVVLQGYAATCTSDGLTNGRICTVCKCVFEAQEKIEKTGHDEKPDAAIPSTCLVKGKSAGSHCSICGTIMKFPQVEPLADHKPVILEAIPVGCLTDGLTKGEKCSVCGKILAAQEIIPHTGHTEVEIPAQEATCQENGKTAGVECSVCHKILVEQEVTNKADHDLVYDAEIPATCYTAGKEAGQHCKNCDYEVGYGVIPQKEHSTIPIAAVEPTCTDPGHTAGTYCTLCETYLLELITIDALGHNVELVDEVPAACNKPGHKAYYKCKNTGCGLYFSDAQATEEVTYTSLETTKEHSIVPYEEVEATCQHSGYTGGTYCSVCNTVITKRTDIPQTEHSWNNGEITTTPKCNELGVKTYTCIWCPQTKTEDVEMIAHTPGAETTENIIQATATEKGGYDTVVRCSVCLTELSRVHSDIPEGHFLKAQAKENEVKADCENDGSYDLVIRWYDTNEIFTSEHIVVQKLGHDLQDVAAQEQTCTQDGWDAYKYCTRCKYTTKVLKPALNHNMTHYAYVAPTCKTEGKLEYWYCSNCKVFFTKEDTTEFVAKEADLVLAKNPENHAVELVHTEAKEAVCNASGNIEYWSCSACQKNFSDEAGTVAVNNVITTNADNHDLTYYEGKKPTCTKDGVFTDGYTAYSVCNRCKKVFGKEVVKSKGHNYTVLKEYKPTTCGEEYKQFVRCLDCGYETTLVTIQKHDYSIPVAGKAPTCLEDGWESYKMCKNCGDYRKTVISKSDAYHQLSDWTVVTPATCTQSGKQVQTCVICGKTVNTKTISATGHTDADKDNKCDTCGSDMPQNSGNWFSRFIQWIKSIFAQIANMFK